MGNYPIIDIDRTGQNIKKLMKRNGMGVRDIQEYLGLATPQSIYHWFSGRNMPTVDNLYALSALFHVPVDEILCGNRKENFYFRNRSFYERFCVYYKTIWKWKAG